MKKLKEMTEQKKYDLWTPAGLQEYYREHPDMVVFRTMEGFAAAPLKHFCLQPAEGLLYDLNRDEASTYAVYNHRMVNDIAVAKVIKFLSREYRDKVNINNDNNNNSINN